LGFYFIINLSVTNTELEMYIAMETTWIPWDSHGNGSDSDYMMGMGVGNKRLGMGMNSHCSIST